MVIALATIHLIFSNIKIENMKFMTFFQVIIKHMACSMEFLTEKMEEVKIADDIFLGNDLSYEEKIF